MSDHHDISSDRLRQLSGAGVSVWLDDLSRELINTGNLAGLVQELLGGGGDHQSDDLRLGVGQG